MSNMLAENDSTNTPRTHPECPSWCDRDVRTDQTTQQGRGTVHPDDFVTEHYSLRTGVDTGRGTMLDVGLAWHDYDSPSVGDAGPVLTVRGDDGSECDDRGLELPVAGARRLVEALSHLVEQAEAEQVAATG